MNTQTENLVWVGEGINCRALSHSPSYKSEGASCLKKRFLHTSDLGSWTFCRIHKPAARRSEGFLKGFTQTGEARVELLYLTHSYGSVGLHVTQRRLAAFPFFSLAIQMWKPDHFIFLAWIQLTLALTELYYHSAEAMVPSLCFIIVSLRKKMKFKFSLTRKIKYYRIWL